MIICSSSLLLHVIFFLLFTNGESEEPKATTDRYLLDIGRSWSIKGTNIERLYNKGITLASPTLSPTKSPTATESPARAPTSGPTLFPTGDPTREPSQNPTLVSTPGPTQLPTFTPNTLPDQCTENFSREISAELKLNFEGDPDVLSDSEYEALASAFVSSYDELGADACFEIVSITIDTDVEEDDNRRLNVQHVRTLQDFTFNFSLIFLIVYKCYGCLFGSTFFTHDASRRRELLIPKPQTSLPITEDTFQFITKLTKQERPLINVANETMMYDAEISNLKRSLQGPPCNPNNAENCKGPERTTFTNKLNDSIQGSFEFQAIETVVETSELEFYDCSNPQTFDTTLNIELEGNYDYLVSEGGPPDRETLDQIRVLERGVRKAYNTINVANQETCDTTFRTMRGVRFNGDLDQTSEDEFIMGFDIEWECYNCPGELFDSGVSRDTFNVDFRENGPIDPLCACAVGASIRRAPTEEEFLSALDITLEVRRRKGSKPFDFVNGATKLPPPPDGSAPPPDGEQGPPPPPPDGSLPPPDGEQGPPPPSAMVPPPPKTSNPSDKPTIPPTNPPTNSPTNSPTNPPISLPSNPPTNPLTNPPTNPPTHPPTNPPTYSPSPQPTRPRTNQPTRRPPQQPSPPPPSPLPPGPPPPRPPPP